MDEILKRYIRTAIMAYDKENPSNTVQNTVECLEALSIELQELVVKMAKDNPND